MRNLDIYITEKLHLDKNISTNITFDSPFDWFDYLRSNGAKVHQDNAAYVISLSKGTKKVAGEKKFTYPFIDIELDFSNNQWNAYWHEDGKIPVVGDDSNDDKYKLFIDVKEFDRNNKSKPFGNHFTSKNADVILHYLEKLYNKI